MGLHKVLIAGLLLAFVASYAEGVKWKLCAGDGFASSCERLQSGNPDVQCQYAQDSVECAKRIQNKTADFGVISAESALHMAVLKWDDLAVVKELREKAISNQEYDFQSVVVIKKEIASTANLRGKRFCHPGLSYGLGQKWTERVYKEFERTIAQPSCEQKSPAEIEVTTLNTFFAQACRPGIWSHDDKEDASLKSKFRNLCALCDSGCKYTDVSVNYQIDQNHLNALNCLKNKGDVAYVSRYDATQYFQNEGNGDNFRYLCKNGTIQEVVNNNNPCVWITQPNNVVISSYVNKELIETDINLWQNDLNSEWKQTVLSILTDRGSYVLKPTQKTIVREYVQKKRDIPEPINYCNSDIRWCTRNSDEKEECEIIRAGGISTGIYPQITCGEPKNGTIDCMQDIERNNSRFMGIDSNYGYLARNMFKLKSAMYYETESSQYSQAVIVVRNNSNYNGLKSLKGAKACLPEFGGTTSVAFVNKGKQQGFLAKKECLYGKLLENFFGSSCAPGAQDAKHFVTGQTDPANLCGLCLQTTLNHPYENPSVDSVNANGNPTCAPTDENRYFGNGGALRCLREQGDVAIVELQSLSDHARNLSLDENSFRIMCANGTLARNNGFNVDDACKLSMIVDGEIVVRRGTEDQGVVNTLKGLDRYFASQPSFKWYNIFNGQKNLLFKDSTLGLTPANTDSSKQNDYVKNYIQMFADIDKCNSAASLQISAFTALLVALISRFI